MVYNLMVHPFFVFENLQQSIKNKPKIKFIAENFLLRWHPEVWFFKCLNEWKLMPISSFPVLLFTEKKRRKPVIFSFPFEFLVGLYRCLNIWHIIFVCTIHRSWQNILKTEPKNMQYIFIIFLEQRLIYI